MQSTNNYIIIYACMAFNKVRTMKQLILNIEEDKFRAFLSFIKTLDYVSVSKGDQIIPEWQQEEVSRRIKLLEKGK